MNRIYRLVFNTALGLVQVASELGGKEGKRHDRRKTDSAKTTLVPARTAMATAIALALGAMTPLLWTTPVQAAIASATGVAGRAGGAATAAAPGAGGPGAGSGAYVNDGGVGGTTGAGGAGAFPGKAGYGPGGSGGKAVAKTGGYDYGGGGGGGGAPAYLVPGMGSYQVLSGTALIGGYGGNGGAGYSNGGGGNGGVGGAGLYGNGFALSNAGTITGGAGGNGGSSLLYPGVGMSGGVGIWGSGFTVTNTGTISGGNNGTTGSLATRTGTGVFSAGGASIINSGTIRCGVGSTSIIHPAVEFTGGGNTLTLLAGSYVYGNVTSYSGTAAGGDTLELGGTTSSSLSGTFAAATPLTWSGTPVFANFQILKKSGSSTWTITTVTDTTANAIPNWDVEAGILQLASGDNFNALAADNLTMGIAPTGSAVATAGTDNGELVVPGTATLNGETLTVNAAAGTYSLSTQYHLINAGAVSGKFGSVSTSGSLGGLTAAITYTSTDVTMTLQAPAPTATGLTSVTTTDGTAANENFTISGAGTLAVSATSSNTALLPDANITGASACTAAGGCTLNLTPVSGQTGTATVTVTVADSYAQTGSGTFLLTVTASGGGGGTTGGGGTSSGGGAFGLLSLFGLLGLAGVSRGRARRTRAGV